MDIKCDCNLSDVDAFFDKGRAEIIAIENTVGKEAVKYAVDHGAYQNRTGRLRRSNTHQATPSGLILSNSAPYSSFVESKGFDVLSSAALHAEKRLREEVV